MVGRTSRWSRGLGAAGVGAVLAVALAGAPAVAAEGSIDHVEPTEDGIRLLFSLPDLGEDVVPDVDSLTATIDGQQVEASAVLAEDSSQGVRRTTVLAMDVSLSMRGDRFEQAKAAAKTFLASAPADVFVGIVTFSDDVEVVQEPTLNHAAAGALVDDLTLSRKTMLYDGIRQAVRTTGDDGQRSVLVLSDGGDTSDTRLEEVTAELEDSEVLVDVVALAQSPANQEKLKSIASAGSGTVLETDDPKALSRIFASQAEALSKQVLVTAPLPPELPQTEASVAIALTAAGEEYTDSAYVTVQTEKPVVDALGDVLANPEDTVAAAGGSVSSTTMLAGLAALAIGFLLLLLSLLGVLSPKQKTSVEDRITAYTRSGSNMPRPSTSTRATGQPPKESLGTQARAVAQKALEGKEGREAKLASTLEAAGMGMRPAEWVLTQAAVAFGAGIFGLLLGGPLFAIVMLFGGLFLPRMYLRLKKRRRIKAFNNQLAETLQLMAGSLSAGLSLAQSADTVVREGSEPITSEFKRALVEARLGVAIEDGFEAIADRMESKDFRWVVMAIRIQREVGGNLAEVLTQVAATIRERAYLRRQVKALSAEGVMSAWILGLLPVVIVLFFLLTRPEYLQPMVTSGIGWLLTAGALLLMAMGSFWMRQIVKMEV